MIAAYKSTSLTSVMLLECWTIPCVMFLRWLFLREKYGFHKVVGAAVCVVGLVTVVLSDVLSVGKLST